MAYSLLVRSSSRLVSNLLASSSSSSSVTRPHHPRGFSFWHSPDLDEFGHVQNWDFCGKVMAKIEKHVLRRLPYTMCRTARGGTLESVSLSIPGDEERTETDEALNVFLDFDAKNVNTILVHSQLLCDYNALFVRAHVQPTSDASFKRLYSSRINLGNDIMYKTIHAENKDGGILITLHKNPYNA